MIASTKVDDHRIDVDRRDLLDAVAKRACRVVATPCAHDQGLLGLVVEQVGDVVLAQPALG